MKQREDIIPIKERTKDNIDKHISALCEKIDEVNQSILAFLPEEKREQRLWEDAKALQNQSPLFGLSVGVKDIFYVDDLPTRAGSKLPFDAFHGEQATVVTQLKQAGALIVGKTVTAEFAFAEPNETVNPVDITYSPGGSSSGSAAAVAAGLCDLGIGTQTVGSTIRPASYCGIVGFKCSYGRIATSGMIYFAPSLDTVGLLTKDLSSLSRVTKIVVKNWDNDVINTSQPVLGIPIGKYLEQADSEILKIFDQAVQKIKKQGYTIKYIPLFENITEINESIWTIGAYEMAKQHKIWYPKYKQFYRQRTREQIEKGQKIATKTYEAMLEKQKEVRKTVESNMRHKGIDLWICPAATTYPPKMSTHMTGNPAMNIPWTFAGLPSISLPIKESGILPLGLQVIAPFGKDEMLLQESIHMERIIQ